jgi:hypothetical protein
VFGYYIIAPPIFYYSSVNNLLHVNHNIIVLSTIYYSNVNSLLELRQQSIMSPPTIKFCVMLSTFVILYFNTSNMCIISAPRQIRRHFAYIDIYIHILHPLVHAMVAMVEIIKRAYFEQTSHSISFFCCGKKLFEYYAWILSLVLSFLHEVFFTCKFIFICTQTTK